MARADKSMDRTRAGARVPPPPGGSLGRDPVAERAYGFLRDHGSRGRQDLIRLLSRVHQVPAETVLQSLARDSRFRVGPDLIQLADTATPTPDGMPTAAPPCSDLLYTLSLLETDEVRLSVEGEIRVRCDFVRAERDEIWVSAKTLDEPLHLHLAALPGAHQLSPGLRLPLRPSAAAPDTFPGLVVWKAPSPAQACHAVDLLQRAWPTQGRWRFEVVACSPAELERRVSGHTLIRRLGSRAERGTPVRDCAHCGLPLSDPTSVRLGIGPECRRHYHGEVLRAAATTRKSGVRVRLGAKKPTQWIRSLRPWLEVPSRP